MKKRVISMLLAISMIASLVCVPAFADDVTGGDDHDHIVSDVQDEGQEQGAPDGGQEGGAGPDEAITPPITSTDESDIPTGEPEEIVYTTCIHGKTMGETCELCGELAHSSKNIPLIGYDQEFFDQVNPDEDEGWLLYTIRLVCLHGTADGVYCEKCGHVVDNDPADLPMCTILDCCLHGHVKGEKCEACQELKEEQGDYELAEGEAWDDPLIYATDLMAFDSNVADMNGSGMLHCSWCGTALGDGINVACHWDSSKGQYHWCAISRVEASGTCESHYVTWVYKCGVRISTNNSPYPCHHTGNCTWGNYKKWHTDILSTASCLTDGRTQRYYTNTCTRCGAESSPRDLKTDVSPKLDHIITGCEYKDSNTHQIECAGNETSAHTFDESHTFEQDGEDYRCTSCDAVKTTVHVDAYTTDGELVKENLITALVQVGHDGPEIIYVRDYLDAATKAAKAACLYPTESQDDSAEVHVGGIHLKFYVILDTEAPVITVTQSNGVATIMVYDDLSGLKEITYFDRTTSVDRSEQNIGEENAKVVYRYVNGFASGTYQITATDYAGNIRVYDVEVEGDLSIDDSIFSMYVPSSITFSADKNGNVTCAPSDAKIYNGSTTKPICITGINVIATGEWKLVDYSTDFSQYGLDTKFVALSINGVPVSADGAMNINKDDWKVEADSTLDLVLDIKVPGQTVTRELPEVLKVNFTGDWYSTEPVIRGTNISRTSMDGVFGENGANIKTLRFDDGNPTNGIDISENQDRTVLATLDGDSGVIYMNNSYLEGSIAELFKNYGTMESLDASLLDTSHVTSMHSLFNGCKSLKTLDIANWDTGNVTSMGYLFSGCTSLASLNIADWDTSQVTTIGSAFSECTSLNTLDVSKWNTSNVTDMGSTFKNCKSLTSLDLSRWNTGKVKWLTSTFEYCKSLTSLNVSTWNIRNAQWLSCTFFYCSSLRTLDLSNWDFRSLDKSDVSLLVGACSNLTRIYAKDYTAKNLIQDSSGFPSGCTVTY